MGYNARKTRTMQLNKLSLRERLQVIETRTELPEGAVRPQTRGDCANGPRPCPWASCRYNLLIDVLPNGNIVENFPDKEPEEAPASCALDVAADEGGSSLERVGELVNLTRERVRQIEWRAVATAKLGMRGYE